MENSLWIALMALAISALGPLGNLIIKHREANQERHNANLRWRRDFLFGTMNELIELRGQLQFYQNKGRDNPEEANRVHYKEILEMEQQREVAYGKAFALMLTIPNSKIRGRAGQVMDPAKHSDENEKLQAINDAIIALGDLLDRAMGDEERISKL